MKRRNVLLGLGGLAGVGSLFSTGAFTTVTAQRRVGVRTADDNNALLRLKELGDGGGPVGGRSVENGGSDQQVAFSFPGTDERLDDPDLGLGSDSVYEFDRDSGESDPGTTPTEGLLRIENQGTQTVDVYSDHETSSELEIELYDVTDSDRTALSDEPVTLDTGDHVDVGFRIRTFNADIGTFDETLTIVAEATDD